MSTKPASSTKNMKFDHNIAKLRVAEYVKSHIKPNGFTIIRLICALKDF